jgi:hypothetical protein
MDAILNQERGLLTKYNQDRILLGQNIGMEAYIQKFAYGIEEMESSEFCVEEMILHG